MIRYDMIRTRSHAVFMDVDVDSFTHQRVD